MATPVQSSFWSPPRLQQQPALRIVRYYPRAVSGDGGMTNAVRHWSEGMVRAGSHIVIAFDDGVPPQEWSRSGIEWAPVPHAGSSRLRMPVGLRSVLRDASLLVLHSAWTPQNIWAARLARKAGVPYVLEPRGAYDPHIVQRHRLRKRAWWLLCERELVMKACAIHVFFDPEREHLRRLGYKGNVVVAPNGVSAPDVAWDCGSGGFVLWMGRYDPEHKGLDLLVRAVYLLPEHERPEVRLHGPEWHDGKARVQRLVQSLRLEPWVKVGGPVHGREKYELLARAAGFVYPSRWEGFGNSVAEAVAVGVPTLVTPYPFGRYLLSRQSAILADATPQSLAEGLRRLRSPEAREIAARGSELVRREITWNNVAASWLEQVRKLL